uniref:Heat shock 70 kDa protein 12A-like isoform X2 n=1 Tax=Crassostrea virginica TaxID=6565 RepID=A0A8B8AWV3_CRAVI|nr:heat shock 70 kDa protein 12A-like isoform X2 [Crassostrea virginica]
MQAGNHKEKLKSKCKRLLVAAIDFGTTYSGYALSWKSEWRKVHLTNYMSDRFLSSKTPSILLLNPDKSFCAFGYWAENTFKDLIYETTHATDSDSDDSDSGKETQTTLNKNWNEYYYFHRFKMLLYDDKTLHRNSEITDASGKRMKAMDIFSISIKHLKDRMLNELNKRVAATILETDIDFVLTVPAIWGDAAKMFMREAAIQAGINTDQLVLALESEAASIYCQFCHYGEQTDEDTFSINDAFRRLLKEKREYMVVDLGGGTVDITVHKSTEDQNLEEVMSATGGPFGGTTVDTAFEKLLEIIGSKDILSTFKKLYMEDYLLMSNEFEAKKRDDGDHTVRITIPLVFETLIKRNRKQTIVTILEKSEYKELVTYKNKKLCIQPSLFKSFFQEATDGIIKCIADVLKHDSCAKVSDIIMVGGFSESRVIQRSLKKKFNSFRFLIPDEPVLAVLKGAVYFGHLPNAISIRVARYTYGVQICPKFKPGDPEDKKIILGGSERCKGVLHPIVRRGDRIQAGRGYRHYFFPLENEEKFNCGFYVSEQREPKYVDDIGCRRLGSLTIEIPNTKQDKLPKIEETFIFGETELTFFAKIQGSRQPIKCCFDMLDVNKLP